MSAFAKLRAPFRRTATDDALGTSVEMTENPARTETKKDPATATDEATDDATASNRNEERSAELPDENVQYGVQDVEAVTLSWSRTALIMVFAKYVLVLSLPISLCIYPAS